MIISRMVKFIQFVWCVYVLSSLLLSCLPINTEQSFISITNIKK